MSLHVGLNLIFLVPEQTGGMEIAARALIPALRDADPSVRFTAFVNQEAASEDFGIETHVLGVRASRRREWVRGEQVLLPAAAQRAGCQLVHSLASTAPAWGHFRRVVTIHDLNYKMVPDAHFGLRGLGMRALVPLAARSAHRILSDSSSTRDDLVQHLGVPPQKVDVVPLGVGRPPSGPAAAETDLRQQLGLGRRQVLLSLSAKRPHKNLLGLLDALALIHPDRRPIAVLPGYSTPHEQELRERAAELGLTDDVRFLGWTPDAQIEGLFASAALFVFPSFYEGFGLPVLEAMARGVPVACSDRASLPEVAGDAALLFDPEDPSSIARAIERILGDAALADRLRAAGIMQAARFTWHRAAVTTLFSYERALGSSAT